MQTDTKPTYISLYQTYMNELIYLFFRPFVKIVACKDIHEKNMLYRLHEPK